MATHLSNNDLLCKQINPEFCPPFDQQRIHHLIRALPCALYDYVLWPDGRNQFIYISPQCETIFESDAESIMQDSRIIWDMVHPDDRYELEKLDREANQNQSMFQCEVRIIPPSGKTKWIELTSMPGVEAYNYQTIWSGVILDITRRKETEEERNRLFSELQQALEKVKILSGLLPICASCKKIRDDKGFWNQIESYISTHSEAEFSHSLCPDCANHLYRDLNLK